MTQADDPNVPVADPNARVDLVPVHFQGTFSNPCFWLLAGVLAGAVGAWFLMRRKE